MSSLRLEIGDIADATIVELGHYRFGGCFCAGDWQGSNGYCGMKTRRLVILCLLFGAGLYGIRAQDVAPPAEPAVALNQPAPAKTNDLYHLDLAGSYRRPWNGDYDWLTLTTISFGGMLDKHNSLDAVLGGGVIQLKPGSPADTQAYEPFFLELGIAWQYYLAAPEASWKPYVTAGASLLWMSWEYRNTVDSNNFGRITRDYLEGADGYAGVGLSLRLRKRLDFFGEMDVGGTGFLPCTYSGVHNNLFANFGYVGVRGGLRLTF